jgi:hypothetical protein
VSYLQEEQPLCNWCRLMQLVRGHEEDDVQLVHTRGHLIVLIDNIEVERFNEIPTECLCGRHL